ncbi:MAG: fibronectin type III-like domain-contianing protein, partial [Lachnospiraceae bacterium]|nr:fibronectin type III-like domain-contianing protein [Lachnospiraceae bacterium]
EEIVQCYIQQMTGRRVRPVRQLKDFTKISLKAGETKMVTFVIPYAGLSYYDWEMKEVPGEGIVKIYVGGDSQAELAGQAAL